VRLRFLNSDGSLRWSSTPRRTRRSPCTQRDCRADIDANPANGYEVAVCGTWLLHSTGIQAHNCGRIPIRPKPSRWESENYRPDLQVSRVVLLDRLRTAAEGYKSNNVLVTYDDTLLLGKRTGRIIRLAYRDGEHEQLGRKQDRYDFLISSQRRVGWQWGHGNLSV